MNKDPEIFNDDLELENLLKPRAGFRVSPDFKQRVMEEAKAMPIHRSRRRWIPIAAASAAASLAALVILALTLFRNPESSVEEPSVTASIEVTTPPSADTVRQVISSPLLAEATTPIRKKTTEQKRPMKKQSAPKAISSREAAPNETSNPYPQPATEGEMRKISHEGPLNPDDVRTHLLETRRNAEIAYIEQMRDEIEANQAYIAQLMAEVDVNQ